MRNLQKFIGTQSGREIFLNTSIEKFSWLREPSYDELDALLLEHEGLRIAQYWTERLLTSSEGSSWLLGFMPIGKKHHLRFFDSARVIELLGLPRQAQGLGTTMRKMPLERQRAYLCQLQPTCRKTLSQVASSVGMAIILGPDMRGLLKRQGSPTAFLRMIEDIAGKHTRGTGELTRYLEVLTMMRRRQMMLFPASYWSWQSRAKWAPVLNPAYAGSIAGFIQRVDHFLCPPGGSSQFNPLGRLFTVMTSSEQVGDLSTELIDATETILLSAIRNRSGTDWGKQRARGAVSRLNRGLRLLWNADFPDRPFHRVFTREFKPNALKRTSGEFGWISHENPELVEWVKPLAEFVSYRRSNTKQGVLADLNYFLDYIRSLPEPPLTPKHVVRRNHIFDATLTNTQTFMRHVGLGHHHDKRKNRMIGYLREFFSWYRDYLSASQDPDADLFQNPVAETDGFAYSSTPGQTHRTALPGWLLNEMKSVITDHDFAFPKGCSRSDLLIAYDKSEGRSKRVWWPGTAICLYLLLEIPVRSHQARWLDSGQFDEFVYNFNKKDEVLNPDRKAVKGRKQGCFRFLSDTLRQTRWLGLYVNTNKTALYDGRSPTGYVIPYLSEVMTRLLKQVLDWQVRYMPPLVRLVTYKEASYERSTYSKVAPGKLPKIAPLFRNPKNPGGLAPVSYDKLRNLYIRVLEETERRVQAKSGIKIRLVTERPGGGRTYVYDLHTLRVSGISSMIESGAPLEVVSQFLAGHATLVMTLWYLKNSPGQLRDHIQSAMEKTQQDSEFVHSREFIDHIEQFSPFLLSKDTPVALTALKQNTGLWTVSSEGICPGTSCTTGGMKDEGGSYGQVPGGRRCALCRYWITGPAFLLGQVAECNNLIYQIRKKGGELKNLRDRLIEAEDAVKRGMASRLRCRIEMLEKELAIDIEDWMARYHYATASSNLLEEYVKKRDAVAGGHKIPVPLMTPNSEKEFQIVLQETDEFVLLDHITQMTEFITGFTNREAILQKHVILTKLLSGNGLDPFLLRLNDSDALEAGNLLSSLLLKYVRAQDIGNVLSGTTTLDAFPELRERIQGVNGRLSNRISYDKNTQHAGPTGRQT